MEKCSKCILSTVDDPNIQFDNEGVCNYCHSYDSQTATLGSIEQRTKYLESKVSEIKNAGRNKKYDCIIGLSGGTDSSFMAHWVYENGLRPLVVHLDNGWNSELSVKNIENICQILKFDLHTYVIDWEEFKQLQLAYLKASVIDIEVLTDHAIGAVIYKMAKKYDIRYTLSGFNLVTEAIMPKGWTYDKRDFLNIKDIFSKYGDGSKISTFPTLTFWKKMYFKFAVKLESVHVLNYLDYNKNQAQELIKDKLNWVDYGGKHYESLFTKFYQAYILPNKFGVDKRKAHLSNLVCSGQITRKDALLEIQKPLYDDLELENEKEYVIKKFNLTEIEFTEIMNLSPQPHDAFDSEQRYWDIYFKIINLVKKLIGKN